MAETTYRDLAEYGLPLISPGEPTFDLRFEEIRSLPRPFGPDLEGPPDRAAVLENQTVSAVITLTYVWRYTTTNGETRTSTHLSLGSSVQMDVLTGRKKAARDLCSFILPGSRRLITEQRMFGNNSGVLAPQHRTGGGWMGSISGSGRGGRAPRGDGTDDVAAVELELDAAIFEDGLCVGPDQLGLRESLTEQMQRQRNTAGEIVQALRKRAAAERSRGVATPLPSQIPKTAGGDTLAPASRSRLSANPPPPRRSNRGSIAEEKLQETAVPSAFGCHFEVICEWPGVG
jgi:hypothetical protein